MSAAKDDPPPLTDSTATITTCTNRGRRSQRPWRRTMLFPAVLAMAVVAFTRALVQSVDDRAALASLVASGKAFDWRSIPTAEDLSYAPCYQHFECARIHVPLDWRNASNTQRVSLAVIRLPATVPESDPSHGGTIITNPGGPGASGVQQALSIARRLQSLLHGPKSYEILSFDPRGVLYSEPNAYCFADAVEAEIWAESNQAAGSLDAGPYALNYNWAAGKARGQLCAQTPIGMYEDGQNIRLHMSSAYVARDMLHIVDKIEKRKHDHDDDDDELRNVSGKSPGTGRLQFLGTSYGTFLGQSFAAMYPDRVKRMVLDANLDAFSWTSRYHGSIDDAAEIQEYFYPACFAAGSACALYREYDTSADDIKNRLQGLMRSLDESPSYVTGAGRATPITIADLRQGFFTTSYQPLWFFSKFAKFANDLLTGVNPDPPFWQLPTPKKNAFDDLILTQQYQNGELSAAVHCGDGPDLSDEGLVGFKGYLANLTARFVSGADSQAYFKLPCWTWPSSLRTKWRFDGPFNASVPILFVNNRLDPATPLRSAIKMSAQFNGSVLLEQDSMGHGALWPAGECMWKHTKRYFDTGELPPKGTVCMPLCRPFSGGDCEGIADDNYIQYGPASLVAN